MSARPLIETLHGVEAYRQMNADSACFGVDREQAQAVQAVQADDAKARFEILMKQERLDGFMQPTLANCIAANMTDDDQLRLVRACLRCDFEEVSRISQQVLADSAEYFADMGY